MASIAFILIVAVDNEIVPFRCKRNLDGLSQADLLNGGSKPLLKLLRGASRSAQLWGQLDVARAQVEPASSADRLSQTRDISGEFDGQLEG